MSTYADYFSDASEAVLAVLDDGVIDPLSRERLGAIYRNLANAAAIVSPQPPMLDATDEDPWVFWCRWCDHVGSIHYLKLPYVDAPRTCIAEHAWAVIQRARLVWCDELDAMSDRELRAVPGIGPKAAVSIRAALDAYYWRHDDADVSRELWQYIERRLRSALDDATRPPEPRRGVFSAMFERGSRERHPVERITTGLELAQRIIAERGAPIADPRVARMVV
jgi:hypothetical protein